MSRESRAAGFWIRSFAALIDTLIVLTLSSPIEFLVFHFLRHKLGDEDFSDAVLSTYLVFSAAYHILFVWKKGATPGKSLFGLKVQRLDGSPLRLAHSITRWFGFGVSCFVFGAGYLMAAFHPRKRTLHDLLAGSEVVKK